MFCKYCGNQIPDGEVCTCPEAIAARETAQAPAEPIPTPVTPAPDAGAQIVSALKSVPGAMRILSNDTHGPGIALPTAIVLAIGGLLLNILAWVCLAGGILGSLKTAVGSMAWAYLSKVFSGIYGFGILGGLLTFLVPIVLSAAIPVVGQFIRKEKLDLLPALTTGICVNLMPAALFLAGALIALLLPVVGGIVILIGVVASLAADYRLLGALLPDTKGAAGSLIAAAVIAVIAWLMVWIVYGVITGYIEGPLTEQVATLMGESLGDLSDLLGGFLGGF